MARMFPWLSDGENEVIQTGVDNLKDNTQRGKILDEIKEGGLSVSQGTRNLYYTRPGVPHILECVLIDAGIDPSRSMVNAIGTETEMKNPPKDFWIANAPRVAVRGICEHKFFGGFLGEANPYSGRDKDTVRANHHQFQAETAEPVMMPQTRASDNNTVDGTVSDVGEPIITYLDRPIRDSERTMYQWGVQDLIAEVVPLPAGTLSARQVVSEIDYGDESMETALELTSGPLVQIKATQDYWNLQQYRLGIMTSDEFMAGAVRMTLFMRTHARIGRLFNRACTIRMLGRIAEALNTGNTHYGEAYTQHSSETSMTGQHWGAIEDSYEVETMNRVVGNKAAIRAIKEMNMGTDHQTYSQYMQRPTNFYDLGDAFADIGLGGINSGSLDSAYTDKSFFTFDVMNTCILYTAPWLEQDQSDRDAPTGSLLTSLRTAVREVVEDPNSIRKGSWS